jgi:hypothetical protein
MISPIAKFILGLEIYGFLLTLIIGVGFDAYLGVSWMIHWVNSGEYLVALLVAGLLCTVVALALLRIAVAQILVFGSAIICGTALFLGYGEILLP